MVERQPHPSNRAPRIRSGDGFDLAHAADEEGDYDVAPAECKSLAELRFEEDPPRLDDDTEEQELPRGEPLPSFTVTDLMIFVTFAAVGLSAVRWLPPGYFAGAASALAIIALLVDRVWRPQNALGKWMIWGVVTIYFSAAIASAILHWTGGNGDEKPSDEQNLESTHRIEARLLTPATPETIEAMRNQRSEAGLLATWGSGVVFGRTVSYLSTSSTENDSRPLSCSPITVTALCPESGG